MYKKGRTPFCRQTVTPTRIEADKDTPKLNRLRMYFYGRVIDYLALQIYKFILNRQKITKDKRVFL